MTFNKYLLCLFILFGNLTMWAQVEDLDDMVEEDSDSVTISMDELNADHSCQRIDSIVNFAMTKLGKRYKYGSEGPYSFDCSGLMYYTFQHFGIKMQRSSSQQYKMGKKVSRENIRKGDLVFFLRGKPGHRYIGHVGLVISVDSNHNFKFIHSSSPKYGVRIDNGSKESYALRYAGARRIIECDEDNHPHIIPDEPMTDYLVVPIDSNKNDTIQLAPKVQATETLQKPAPKIIYYRIKSGDTLSGIGRKYHVSVANLKKWNGLKSDFIREGKTLKIYR